jgi:Ca-activated chloride channel homolog
MSWPGFFSLSSAWLALLFVPLVIFYFLKLKRPRQRVSSLLLWYQVVNDQRVNSPFQKFKRNLLLLLQILVLACLVLAAMQPYLRSASPRAQYQPVLIDCSASMAALDKPGGITRMEAAKKQVETLIDNLLPDQQVALIAFHSTARRLTDFTDNKRILKEALAKLEVSPVRSQTIDALRMSQALSRTVPIERVLLVSDGNVPTETDFELPFELVFEQVPPGGPNMGITSFNARRASGEQWEVFVGVEGSPGAESTGKLELFRDGALVGSEPVLLVPGRGKRLVFRLETAATASLEARLTPDGFDSLALDNVAYMQIPKSRPLSVYAPSTLPAFRRALSVQKGIELDDETKAVSGTSFDLIVSDRPEDVKLESQAAFFVGFVPKDLEKLVSIIKGSIDVVDWDRSSALLQHVLLSDVTAVDQPKVAEGVHDGDFEKLGYTVLAFGRTGPLLLEKRLGARLEYYFLPHTDHSTLPYRVAFPILAANLVEIGRVQSGLSEVHESRTGVLPPLQLKPKTTYRVTGPAGISVDVTSTDTGLVNGVAAPAIGQYRVTEGGTEVARIGVSLLDSMETSLVPVSQLQFRENLQVAATSARLDADRPLWPTILLLGLGILLVEWWYFQRRPGGVPS